MSTITDLAADTTGSASMGIINTNFDNLNTDKIEATQTVALTNKTIDGDLNTVQDLPYTAIKSTARTGSDTKLATGTPGSTDELSKWNVDGDLVSAGVTVSTSAPTTSSLDTTIPTSQAVSEAIVASAAAKQIFVPVVKHSADAEPYDDAVIGDFATSNIDSSATAYFAFCVPTDYVSLTSIEVVTIPDTTETIQLDVATDIGADGESRTTHSGAASNVTKSVTTDTIAKFRIDNATGTPFAAMLANDVVGVAISSDTTMIRIVGLLVKYSS